MCVEESAIRLKSFNNDNDENVQSLLINWNNYYCLLLSRLFVAGTEPWLHNSTTWTRTSNSIGYIKWQHLHHQPLILGLSEKSRWFWWQCIQSESEHFFPYTELLAFSIFEKVKIFNLFSSKPFQHWTWPLFPWHKKNISSDEKRIN